MHSLSFEDLSIYNSYVRTKCVVVGDSTAIELDSGSVLSSSLGVSFATKLAITCPLMAT